MAVNKQAALYAGRTQFQRQFEITPIILRGGIAEGLPGGGMSILQLTEGDANIVYEDANDYFAHFRVQSGGTLQEWGVAEYPFASMAMAANAVIQNPLHVSLIMICPAQANNSQNNYMTKQAKFNVLKTQLDSHMNRGGYFDVATPAYTYTNCLLTAIRDISSGEDKQVQMMYQWDFVQPLITAGQLSQQLNNLYNKLDKQLPTQNPLSNTGVNNVVNTPSSTQPTTPPSPTVP
jgi:hypothetical protein